MPKSRKLRPSSERGINKSGNCQKSAIKTQYCKDTKWYKKSPQNYATACAIVDAMNRQ